MKKQGAQGLDCYDEIPFLGTNSTGTERREEKIIKRKKTQRVRVGETEKEFKDK